LEASKLVVDEARKLRVLQEASIIAASADLDRESLRMRIEWQARQILMNGAPKTTQIVKLVDNSKAGDPNLIRINRIDPRIVRLHAIRVH